MPSALTLPFFEAVNEADTILLAGMGGGYDIYPGLPLYFALRDLGKTVHLANLSFSALYGSTGERLGEALVKVTHRTEGSQRYFPEMHLARWFQAKRHEDVPIYCFDRVGARPIAKAYRRLVNELGGVDAVVLVDGGTDSLMRGDESGLGTPEEDSASLAAVHALEGVATKLLVNIGFGVDTFHGVSHAQFLEAVAALAASGDFLGAWSLTPQMPEVSLYGDALEFVHAAMFNNPSIVASSVLAGIDGHFGNYHPVYRTQGSELFINPLMGLYWAFQLDGAATRNLYLHRIRATESYMDLQIAIGRFRDEIQDTIKPWVSLPM